MFTEENVKHQETTKGEIVISSAFLVIKPLDKDYDRPVKRLSGQALVSEVLCASLGTSLKDGIDASTLLKKKFPFEFDQAFKPKIEEIHKN